MILLRPFF